MHHNLPCRGPVGITRRNMLQIGGVGLLQLSVASLLKADSQRKPQQSASADACILVFLNGGPSHLDTWDMKPNLPSEMKSEFKPIPSTIPGVPVCEHLPRLARCLHRLTLVRSVHHDQVAHAPAVYTALTGIRSNIRAGIMGASRTDYPAIGSVVGRQRPPAGTVPPYVLLPHLTAEGAGGPPQPGFLAGWLGKGHDPLLVLPGSRPDSLQIPALDLVPDATVQRLHGRRDLMSALQASGQTAAIQDRQMDALWAKAFDLVSSPQAQRAFKLDSEPAPLRDRYGRNVYGQSLLLARRLIEAGTRLVCISWAPDANATWDTHGNNFVKLKNELLPQFDLGFTALLDDLEARGMLDRTLVVAMGEIGRTPKVNGNAGRDHWEFCYTVLFAGGGMKPGFVFGASDKHGAYPKSDPVTAADIIATIYHALGVPPDLELRDPLDRPLILVPDGHPITALFA